MNMMLEAEKNKSIARRWHEAWGTSAIAAAYDECLASDFRAQFFGQGWVDRATYIRLDQEFAAAFSNSHITVDESVAEGDTVMSRMTWRAVHTGTFQGIQPTDRRFEIMGFAVDRFRNGRVVEHVPLFDQFSLFQQLGLIAGMGQPETANHPAKSK
jgi:predicted ester cyclase